MDERNENLTPPEDDEIFDDIDDIDDISEDVSNVSNRENVSIAGDSPQGIRMQGDDSQVQQLAHKADEAVNKATNVVNKAADEVQKKTHEVGDFITESSGQVANTLDHVSKSLRETAQDMNEHEHPVFGRYVRSAAETMERFSDSLRHKDLDFFVDRTEDLARNQPGIFLGSAFTMGFAIGRYLKGKSSDITETIRHKTHEVVQSAGVTSGSQEHKDPSETWH